jgi:outer membrane protein TolC
MNSKRAYPLILIAQLSLAFDAWAQEPESPAARAGSNGAPRGDATLADVLDKTPSDREKRIARTIEEALGAKNKAGTWRRLENKKLVRLSASEAALAGLKKNLGIEISRHDAEFFRRAILEAEAVFDPELALSFRYDESDTFERKLFGTVQQQQFTPCPDEPGDTSRTGTTVSGPIPGRGTDCFLAIRDLPSDVARRVLGATLQGVIFGTVRAEPKRKEIFASRTQPNGPTQTGQYNVALSQLLPWGPSYDISVLSTDRDVFFDNQGHSFGAPWASELLFNLRVPLPGGNNFGPYSVGETARQLAYKRSERGFWALKETINSTMRAVDLAYLNVVQGLEELLIRIDNRQLVERQVEHARRLFDQGYAANYDVAQIEAELAAARAEEEVAKNRFVQASDGLATLTEHSQKSVQNNIYLPTDYAPWLESRVEFDTASALATAQRHRPELQGRRVDYEASEIAKRNAALQTRPDVNLDIEIAARQNGAQFGYKSYLDSIGALDSPDTLAQSYSVTYVYPWGNRAVKARFQQAEGVSQDSALVKKSTENEVANEVNDALSNLRTSRSRVQHAEENLKAATDAYNSIAEQAEVGGLVNEDELIINIRNLLDAKLTKIDATIDNKRAESNLLAAQGVISQHYAGMTAASPLDRVRLNMLMDKGGLEYFLR